MSELLIAKTTPLILTIAGLLKVCTPPSPRVSVRILGCGNIVYSCAASSGCGITNIVVSGQALESCWRRRETWAWNTSSGSSETLPFAIIGCDSETKGPSYALKSIRWSMTRLQRGSIPRPIHRVFLKGTWISARPAAWMWDLRPKCRDQLLKWFQAAVPVPLHRSYVHTSPLVSVQWMEVMAAIEFLRRSIACQCCLLPWFLQPLNAISWAAILDRQLL